jgi:hypothetical protein
VILSNEPSQAQLLELLQGLALVLLRVEPFYGALQAALPSALLVARTW